MKKRGVLLLAATIGLMLIACGDSKDAVVTTPGNTGSTGNTATDVTQEESREQEKLPASQEYVSAGYRCDGELGGYGRPFR